MQCAHRDGKWHSLSSELAQHLVRRYAAREVVDRPRDMLGRDGKRASAGGATGALSIAPLEARCSRGGPAPRIVHRSFRGGKGGVACGATGLGRSGGGGTTCGGSGGFGGGGACGGSIPGCGGNGICGGTCGGIGCFCGGICGGGGASW